MILPAKYRSPFATITLAALVGGASCASAANGQGYDSLHQDAVEQDASYQADVDVSANTQDAQPRRSRAQQGPPPGGPAQNGPAQNGPAQNGPVQGGRPESVFDETWITLGVGAGLVPSYSGSDDYRVFPLPLIVGRVGGVGITPNGPGLTFDVLSQPPGEGPSGASFSFGPTVRVRGDRDGSIEDEVVKLAGELDTALELGVQGGVRIPGVLNRFDSVSFSTAVRWDVLGAHEGMLVEPGVGYFTPIGTGAAVQARASASFVDDAFAEYYYSISPAQSAATGLPQFEADGGLNSLGFNLIATFDLDNNLLNGGLNLFAIGGYSRLVGDAADTPFTSQRGSANQLIGGIGIGYTF